MGRLLTTTPIPFDASGADGPSVNAVGELGLVDTMASENGSNGWLHAEAEVRAAADDAMSVRRSKGIALLRTSYRSDPRYPLRPNG
jgi:hypothetical protein